MRLPCTYNIRSMLANDLNRIVEKKVNLLRESVTSEPA